MDTLTNAIVIATTAHYGHVDKAGEPYIQHPKRVAEMLADKPTDVQATAWLHDVIEDSPFTATDLVEWGVPTHVVDAVTCLTKLKGESRDDYYARVKSNPIALVVKLADISDNSNPDRLAKLDPETRERLTQKYAYAVKVLVSKPQ